MAQVQHMEPEGKQSFAMATSLVVKMRANMADAPYTFEKGAVTNWRFSLAYAQLSAFMPLAHQYLAASRLPYSEREEALQVRTTFSCFVSRAQHLRQLSLPGTSVYVVMRLGSMTTCSASASEKVQTQLTAMPCP